jgi:hypothetical protein
MEPDTIRQREPLPWEKNAEKAFWPGRLQAKTATVCLHFGMDRIRMKCPNDYPVLAIYGGRMSAQHTMRV